MLSKCVITLTIINSVEFIPLLFISTTKLSFKFQYKLHVLLNELINEKLSC